MSLSSQLLYETAYFIITYDKDVTGRLRAQNADREIRMATGWRTFIIDAMNELMPYLAFTWTETAGQRRFGYPSWYTLPEATMKMGVLGLVTLAAGKIVQHLKDSGQDRQRAGFMGIWMRDWSALFDVCRHAYGMTDDEYASYRSGRTGRGRGRGRGEAPNAERRAEGRRVDDLRSRDASTRRAAGAELTRGDFVITEEEELEAIRHAQEVSRNVARVIPSVASPGPSPDEVGDAGAGTSGLPRSPVIMIDSDYEEGDDKGKGKRRRRVVFEDDEE